MEWLWGFAILILPVALAYGLMRNRQRTAAEKHLTEAATKEGYRATEREDTGRPLPGDRARRML